MNNEQNKELSLIPELKNLDSLSRIIKLNNNQVSANIDSLHESVTNLAIRFDLKILENSIHSFVVKEMNAIGISSKINSVNSKINTLFDEITFFNEGVSYFTGIFSSDFSSEDNSKWKSIEESLEEIYCAKSGLIKQIQDHFLFNITQEKLIGAFKINEMTFEEELFLRSLLIKGYLSNLRQLITPFYEIDDEILIKFKRDRIDQLKNLLNKEKDSHLEDEIELLELQVNNLQLNIWRFNERKKDSEKLIDIGAQNISAFNTKLNTGSVVFGTVETVRYFTSFIGHKTNSDAFKIIGNFGLNSSNLISKCIPFVSTLVEVGSQVNNNYVVYNYEKKLKVLQIIENVKRNLLILEQQVVDHYISNVLNRLQTILIENQTRTSELVTQARNNHFLTKSKEKEIDSKVEEIRTQYYQNVNLVATKIESDHRTELNKKDEKLIEKDEIINDRETKLLELDEEIVNLTNEIATKKKEFEKEAFLREKELLKLTTAINSRNEELSTIRDLLENERQSYQTQEKALRESLKGDLNNSLRIAYDFERNKRKEFEITLGIVLKQKNNLESDLENLKIDFKYQSDELKSEQEDYQALNERLQSSVDKLKREKLLLQEGKQEIEIELRKLRTEHSAKMSGYALLEASTQELTNSINIETEKCNRYRNEISALEDKLIDWIDNSKELAKTKQNNDFLKEIDKESKEQVEFLTNKLKSLEIQLKVEQDKQLELEEIKKQAWLTKAKLSAVLILDTTRNFLPATAGDYLTKFETILLASEVNNSANKLAWSLVVIFLVFSSVNSLMKLIWWMISLIKQFWNRITVKKLNKTINSPIISSHEDQDSPKDN